MTQRQYHLGGGLGGEEKVYCPAPLKPGKEGFEVTLGGIAGVSEVW